MKVKTIFVSLVVLWIVVTGIFVKTELLPLLKLLYFQFAVIWLPGTLIVEQSKFKLKSQISYSLFSYLLGYAIFLIIYAVLLLTGIQGYSHTIFLIYSLCGIGCWIILNVLKHDDSRLPFGHSGKEAIWLFLGTMVVSFLLFQLRNRPVEIVGYQSYWMDFMYWFRVCVGATQGFPVPDLSIDGLSVFWHYFSCFPVAAIHLFSGIEIYDLCFSYSCIWDMIILVGGVYVFFDETLENQRYVILGSVILLFCSSIEHITLVSHLKFLYQCKLGCSQGLPYAMMSFMLLMRAFESKPFFSREMICALLFCAVTSGLKGPHACVLLAGVGCLCLFTIDNKRRLFNNIITVLLFAFVFLAITLIFVLQPSSLVAEQSNSKLMLSASDTTLHSPYVRHFYEFLCQFIPPAISLPISVLLYFSATNYIILLICILGIIISIKTYKLKDPVFLALLAMSIVGSSMFMFISHPGFSQLYFIFATFPFALLLGLRMLDQNDFRLKKVVDGVIVSLICLSLFCSILFQEKDFYFCGHTNKTEQICSTAPNDFTLKEVIALRWVRDNLPNDVVYVTNKDLSPMWRRSFVTSCFSEKQMLFEASDYSSLRYSSIVQENVAIIAGYFNGSDLAKQELMRKNVHYSILYKGIGKEANVTDVPIYENEAIAVYKLQ